MFISDNLIYIQLEKTACTHISSLLFQSIGGTQFKKHNTIDNYNTDKLIVGSIRNPWDWYVSLWAFATKGDEGIYRNVTKRSIRSALKTYSGIDNTANYTFWLKQQPVKRIFSTVVNSHKGFWAEWNKPIHIWQECYQNPEESLKFRQWLKLIYNQDRAYDLGQGYGQSSLSSFAGLMTFRYCRLYTKDFFTESKIHQPETINQLADFNQQFNILNEIIKVENLEQDLINAIHKANYKLKDEQYNLINQAPKTNRSNHFDICHYYDRETLDLVAEKEKFLVEKYQYKAPEI